MSKIKQKQTKKQEIIYDEWLYLNQNIITATNISDALKHEYEVDLWAELSIISIKIVDENYLDIVEIENDLGEDKSNEYLKQNNIKTVFTAKMPNTCLNESQNIMKQIVEALGGFFVKDNDDFLPIIK